MAEKPKSIDDYLSTVDDAKRTALEKLRATIQRAAPEAEECISYSLPAFRHGKIVCGFGATKKHCSFYLFSSASLEPFANELIGYNTSKGTIRFQPEEPLPASLIHRLVRARLAENAAKTCNKPKIHRPTPARTVDKLYEKYYAGEKARRGLFDALAAWLSPKRVLYPGSYIHVTASFVFPTVTYVDNDRNAKRFYSQMDDVLSFVERNKVYREAPELAFHGSSYEADIDEPEGSFDLLISLYAGFISKPCKRYLKVGGILAANNSHGDAGLASIDHDYKFIGTIQGRGERLRVVEDGLDAYFKPKKKVEVTEELLLKLGRGVGYTKTAPAYLFERVR